MISPFPFRGRHFRKLVAGINSSPPVKVRPEKWVYHISFINWYNAVNPHILILWTSATQCCTNVPIMFIMSVCHSTTVCLHTITVCPSLNNCLSAHNNCLSVAQQLSVCTQQLSVCTQQLSVCHSTTVCLHTTTVCPSLNNCLSAHNNCLSVAQQLSVCTRQLKNQWINLHVIWH